MPYRRTPQELQERVAELEAQLRRLQGTAATTPVITDYSALQGLPTDFVTVAELNAQLAPIAAAAQASELLGWLGLGAP